MESSFKTRFTMSGVATDVSVRALPGDTFACTLNLADFFDGGEFEGNAPEPDITIKRSTGDTWEQIGESKVSLTEHDIENLGKSITEAEST